MKRQGPPKFATWLLQKLRCGESTESLLGDLMEEYVDGRSAYWYWRQVIGAIFIGAWNAVRRHGKSYLITVVAGLCGAVIWNAVWQNPGRLQLWVGRPLGVILQSAGYSPGLVLHLIKSIGLNCGYGLIFGLIAMRQSRYTNVVLITMVIVLVGWDIPWLFQLSLNAMGDSRYLPSFYGKLGELSINTLWLLVGWYWAKRAKRARLNRTVV